VLGPAEPQLTPDERALLERGVALFNDGYYFECHDVLEELWSGVRGPARDFFQGLIQVAVGYYHLGNANREGATSMFSRALKRFERYPDGYFGFALANQRDELRGWIERLARPDVPPDDRPARRPRWSFDASGGPSASA
jgi:predicted metal-dependent hydrolase